MTMNETRSTCPYCGVGCGVIIESDAGQITGVRGDGETIAVFRTAADTVFALADKCPHKGGPLSQGIVFGESVACPLHNWTIGLTDGCARSPDEGCTPRFSIKVDAGVVHVDVDELNSIALDEVQASA